MNRDRVYLQHIRDAIARIQTYTAGGEASFLQDSRTQDAVLRNLEIIGEAVKHLSEEFKSEWKHVPWRQIAGMRDRLIHHYFGVDIPLVWTVVAMQLPQFQVTVQQALDALHPEPPSS